MFYHTKHKKGGETQPSIWYTKVLESPWVTFTYHIAIFEHTYSFRDSEKIPNGEDP